MDAEEDGQRLEFVDTVLYDLAFGGGIDGAVSVRRWLGVDKPGMVVIQSGEDGRREFASPDFAIPDAVVRFVAELQAHVIEVQGELRPACPPHRQTHPLACRAVDGEIRWACPEGDWRCPVGQYDEFDWPPVDAGAETIHNRVFDRLRRRDIEELRGAGTRCSDGRRGVCIYVWPMSEDLTARLRQIAAPVDIEVIPEPEQWWALGRSAS